MLDAWALRLAAKRDPALARGLAGELSRGAYPAIVLFRDLDGDAAGAWYAEGHFGPEIAGEIRRAYRRAGAIGATTSTCLASPRVTAR